VSEELQGNQVSWNVSARMSRSKGQTVVLIFCSKTVLFLHVVIKES